MRATFLVPAAFVGGGLLCRFWLQTAPAAVSTDLAQPLPVVTYWHAFGTLMWLALFLAVVMGAFGYVAAIRDALAGIMNDRKALVTYCVASAAALAGALAFPVLFSSDIYAYGAYGDMGLRGIDPYTHNALPADDALLRGAIWQWGNPPPMCVYGPVFVWIAQTIVGGLARFGPAVQLDGLRVLASLALIACGPLLYAALTGFSKERRLAAAAGVILNPVAIWSAAEGHNDALMLVVVLAGIIVARRAQPTAGALVMALSSLVKAPGLAAAAAFALFTYGNRNRFMRVVAGALAGTAITALIALPFEWGVGNVLIPHGHYTPQFSLQYLSATLFETLFGKNDSVFFFGVAVAVLACLAIFCYGAALTVRGQREGFIYLAAAVWLVIPNPYPWYALWILPVAFVVVNSRASWAVVLASLTIVFRYLPDATVGNDAQTNLIVALCELAIPFALFAVRPVLAPPIAVRDE